MNVAKMLYLKMKPNLISLVHMAEEWFVAKWIKFEIFVPRVRHEDSFIRWFRLNIMYHREHKNVLQKNLHRNVTKLRIRNIFHFYQEYNSKHNAWNIRMWLPLICQKWLKLHLNLLLSTSLKMYTMNLTGR